MAVHARLKNEFPEDGKYHILMSWLVLLILWLGYLPTIDGYKGEKVESNGIRQKYLQIHVISISKLFVSTNQNIDWTSVKLM